MTNNKAGQDFNIRWKSQIKKGLIEYMILLFLEKKTYYGYELIDMIRELSSIEIAEGTLYPLLNRLKKDGMLSSRWHELESGIPRKYYTITNKGAEQIQQMNAYFDLIDSSLLQIRNLKP
ncbi:PadR family transcriptional regulator [Draconibacterium halophilum]|uniref:PadR family transcriptional regulator n=2 Tax=Draconibacterium halophilum TaxID=2706887 RepID=A0A6C0RH13_9BACT|nr:PadR family transcriptional regulator [Draconibacterium halophilum]